MKNLGLKARILLLSGFTVFITALVGGVSQYYCSKTTKLFDTVVKDDVPSIRALNRMLLATGAARVELLQLSAPGATEAMHTQSLKEIDEHWAKADADEKIFADLITDPSEKEIYAEFKTKNEILKDDFKKALELFKKNKSEDSAERKAMAKIVLFELPEHAQVLREITKKLIDFEAKVIEFDSAEADAAARTGNIISLIITVLGSLVGFTFAYLFSTKLSKQINNIIGSISAASDHVASASTQIATSSQELSQSTTEQAASIEETAASLEEIGAMIAKATSNASSAEGSSAESQSKAKAGQKSVNDMMIQMAEISESNDAIMNQVNISNQQMTEIVRVIQEIGTKTKVINEIVFQTKLLSFNASVEAARAGEQGKGFAVVAEEVGNLALMSGNAAKEISEMLEASISKVEQIVNDTKTKVTPLVEQGKQRVDAGTAVAENCSNILNEIVENVATVSALSQEISLASKEQSQGVNEINKAMGQLDATTQQNSATSEQSARAAEQLSNQAKNLKSAVQSLVDAVQGRKDLNSKPATPPSSQAKAKPRQVVPVSSTNQSKPSLAKVIPLKKEVPRHAPVKTITDVKAVIGGDSSIPSGNHSGFQDV